MIENTYFEAGELEIQNPMEALIKYKTVMKLEQHGAKNFTFNSTT
jgi:hypothetical protein